MFGPVYRVKSRSLFNEEDGNVFFAADPHFFHGSMAEKRGFSSVSEMNEALVSYWNSKVGPKDVVFLLGDVISTKIKDIGKENLSELLYSLEGNIYLVLGNHDDHLVKHEDLLARFEIVQHYLEFVYNRGGGDHYHIILHHYPHLTWNRSHFGSFCVHGHCHGKLDRGSRRLDVGYDSLKEWPVPIDDAVIILQEECRQFIYTVIAKRFSGDHTYLVGNAFHLTDAKKMANDHCEYRGGKYSCEVYAEEPYGHKETVDHENLPEPVYTVESPYKSKK